MKFATFFCIIAGAALCLIHSVPVTAQFPIKIPKIDGKKPKIEETKTEAPKSDSPSAAAPAPRAASGGNAAITAPQPPAQPMLLKETLDVEAKTEARFWKQSNKNDNPSWYPQVEFRIFYNEASRQRYNAEWMNPDGTPWFTEQLDFGSMDANKVIKVASPYQSESPYTKAIQTVGTFPFKIVNTKTGETVFQGKYVVKKLPPVPGDSFAGSFYVDHEWNLPLGYIGYDADIWKNGEIGPEVHLWFKGNLETKDFEARLFFNGQEVASTDDGGQINTSQKRGGDCYRYREICEYTLWSFSWENFRLASEAYMREKYSKAIFSNDKPGEYTAKIFHKGTQVREVTFTIEGNGGAARTPYSEQVYPTLGVFPVKVLPKPAGAAGWKTQMFYANPPAGFPAI